MLPILRVFHRKLRGWLFLLIFMLISSLILLRDSPHMPNVRKPDALKSFRIPSFRGRYPLLGSVDDLDDAEVFGEDPLHDETSVPVHAPQAQEEQESKKRLPSHIYRTDGLVEVNPNGRHPIYDLIEKARDKWNLKLAKQSRTLREAVREYKRRYHRDPPLGFDHWWNYAQSNDVQLPDEYDQIIHDIEPFWGIRPADLQRLQLEHESEPGTYTLGNDAGFGDISIVNSSVTKGDDEVATQRSQDQLVILNPIRQWLPPFRATFTFHDAPILFIGHDLRSEAVDAAAVREYIDIDKQWDIKHLGWASRCPTSSPLRRDFDASKPPNISELHKRQPKTFIHHHKQAMNPCNHPDLVHLNGQLTNYGIGPAPRQRLHPGFSMSTTPLHSDILVVAPEMWTDDVGYDPPWEEKLHDTLLWRGTTTGTRNEEKLPWRLSQRLRLVEQTNQEAGAYNVLQSNSRSRSVGEPISIPAKNLNERLMDIGFTDSPSQCTPDVCEQIARDYTFKDRKTWDDANQWKYVIDIDGNGWSARFKRLMTSNAMVLKATICPEWFSDRIMPWLHYVPVKMDLTDLFDIMTFFRGDEDGAGHHDEMARQIAIAGQEWSDDFWRLEDQTSYMFRLFLEWARVLSSDRDKMTFKLPDEPLVD